MDSHHPKTEIQTDQKKTKINTPPPAYLLACIKRIACMVVVKEKMYVVPEEKQLSYDL
jgi:hypothetical protein